MTQGRTTTVMSTPVKSAYMGHGISQSQNSTNTTVRIQSRSTNTQTDYVTSIRESLATK